MVSEFHFQSLVDTVDALRSGHLPAVTLARQMLRRIQSAEALAAYVSVDSEAVLARATALDGQRARGEPLGRLHGIPLALKDLVDQAGKVTGAGGTVHGAEEARRNATVVDRLLGEGAIILGKLRLTEGAYSSTILPCRRPGIPGLRSIGLAFPPAAPAWPRPAGLCFGALGTDTGAPFAFPAPLAGWWGEAQLWSGEHRRGLPLAPSLDHLGPMARSVRDAARLLTVLAGPDPADVRSQAYGEEDFEAALATGVAGLRVAFPKELWRAGVASALTEAGAAAAEEALAEAGVAVGGAAPPSAAALIDGWALTAGVEAALVHEKTFPAQRGAYGPVLSTLLDRGHRASAPGLRPLGAGAACLRARAR